MQVWDTWFTRRSLSSLIPYSRTAISPHPWAPGLYIQCQFCIAIWMSPRYLKYMDDSSLFLFSPTTPPPQAILFTINDATAQTNSGVTWLLSLLPLPHTQLITDMFQIYPLCLPSLPQSSLSDCRIRLTLYSILLTFRLLLPSSYRDLLKM